MFDTPEDLLRFSDRYDDTLFLLSIAKEADNKLGQISIPDLHTGSCSDSRPWIAWLKSNKNTIMNPRYRDSGFWRGVIDLAAYLAVHPDSGCFPRELPVPVDTKFLETNHVLVIGLLCTFRPDLPVLFDKQLSWEHQLGLRKKEDMIQIRLPMPAQIMVANEVCTQTNHVIIPKEAFIAFSYPHIKKVFIIENETLFLTFPLEDGELALYKGGFAITALRGAPWLELCKLYYFSDIDEHGFAMLSLMRGMYPKVQSFCMDIQTYEQFSEFKGTGKNYPGEYTGLTASELQVLEMLRVDGQHVRLEQEHVSLEYIKKRKQSLFNN